jgi:hypothetical protein
MLIHPMAERLRGLGLAAMADAFLDMHNQSAADDLSREDWLGLLIDREVTARDNKRLGRRLNLARLRQNAASATFALNSGLCFFRVFDKSHLRPIGRSQAGPPLSCLSSFRGPPQSNCSRRLGHYALDLEHDLLDAD